MQEVLNRLENNLKRVRSNQISLEVVEELIVEQQGKRQRIKQLAALKINPERQLVIRVFEPKKAQVISKTVLEAQLGYQSVKMKKDELYFSLAPMTGEIRQQLNKKVKEMIQKRELSTDEFPEMKQNLLKILNIKHDTAN